MKPSERHKRMGRTIESVHRLSAAMVRYEDNNLSNDALVNELKSVVKLIGRGLMDEGPYRCGTWGEASSVSMLLADAIRALATAAREELSFDPDSLVRPSLRSARNSVRCAIIKLARSREVGA